MASVLYDCPHCGGKNSAFLLCGDVRAPRDGGLGWNSLGRCGVCKNIMMFEFRHRNNSGNGPSNEVTENGSTILRAYPEPKSARIADSIPENVEKSLQEAESCFHSNLYSAAGSCYRKAMERSLKHLNPDETGMLNKRIRSLEKSGEIPKSMVELLDQVRLFGNETMHDDDYDPTKDDVSSARDFAHLFLTYAFTMPAQVEAAKEKRSNNAES